MNERPTYEERKAMIADEYTGTLSTDESQDLALLTDLLADPSTWSEPSAGLEDAVVHAVTTAAPPASPGTAEVDAHHEASRRRRRRRIVPSAIAAVAASIAIIAGTVVAVGGNASREFTARLTATEAMPGARASASISRNGAGFRVVLDARGLPALPAGEYYQAWLKNGSGAQVAIGSFSSSNGRVTLWSGVSPTDFTAMSVTIESVGRRAPDTRVLSGEVRPG